LKNNFKKYDPRTKIKRKKRWCTSTFDLTPQNPENGATVTLTFENVQKIKFLRNNFKKYGSRNNIQRKNDGALEFLI